MPYTPRADRGVASWVTDFSVRLPTFSLHQTITSDI